MGLTPISIYRDIQADILESNVNLQLGFVTDIIHKSFWDGKFPSIAMYTEVLPVYKKKDHPEKGNYRPASVLLHLSKIFERLILVKYWICE